MKKTAVVTGASRGIGAACARALAEEGCFVVVNYLNSEKEALALAEEIGGAAFRGDAASREDMDRLFAAFGGADVLVANAGISRSGLLQDLSLEDYRRLFAVNAEGVYNACRAAAPYMISKKAGSIITVSSMWGIAGAACEAAYSASKAAVIGLTKSLAKELAPSGIRVNCIAPGVIDTDMNACYSPEDMAALAAETPLGRIGSPEDAAHLAAFLASEKASFITGQIISVDGGFIL